MCVVVFIVKLLLLSLIFVATSAKMGLVEAKLAIIPGAGKTFHFITSALAFALAACECVLLPDVEVSQFELLQCQLLQMFLSPPL